VNTPTTPTTSPSSETVTLPSVERLREVLTDVEARCVYDPESTRYLRGVRDTLRVLLNDKSADDTAAALFLLDDPVGYE
jgi:hypothetical protein